MKWFVALMTSVVLGVASAGAITINEINYDDDGADFEEFVELYHAGGGDFTGYDLVLYTGNDGTEYRRVGLGVIPADGYYVVGVVGVPNVDATFPGGSNQIENGAPDGIAIVQTGTSCVQFLSYEGSFAATDGECATVTSTDIGAVDIDPAGPELDVVLQRIPNGTGTFVAAGDGASNGVAQDGTPGLVNVIPGPGAPTAYGKLTTTQVNTETDPIELCAGGGEGTLSFEITALPASGTLEDGGVTIVAVPHAVVGNLTYVPTSPTYSGLDVFSFRAWDSAASPQPSAVVNQEVAVQQNTVLISEVMYTPSSFQSTYEYIEIYNNSGSAVQLTRLDTSTGTTTDTTDNLTSNGTPLEIPANSMRIIAIDNTAMYPDSAEEFRCEWGSLKDEYIIRIPVDQWEFLFSNADPDCTASTGSRILLFGASDVVLDAVDLTIRSSSNCSGTSYAIDDFMVTLQCGGTLDTECNDNSAAWNCTSNLTLGRRTGVTGDTGSPAFVPFLYQSPQYDDPCYGACCLPDGTCADDNVTMSECYTDLCGQDFALGSTCPFPGTCEPLPGNKCCVPTGYCFDLTECECLLFGGDWDGGDTCDFPNQSTGECPVEVLLVINELDYDTPGTDVDEFIELY
ncbi:MAG: hypothetical protein ABIF77_00355, partial [bacterium]